MEDFHRILISSHILQPQWVLDPEAGTYYIFKITSRYLAIGNRFIFSFWWDLFALLTCLALFRWLIDGSSLFFPPFSSCYVSGCQANYFLRDCVFLLSWGAPVKAWRWLCVWVCDHEVVSIFMRTKCIWEQLGEFEQRSLCWYTTLETPRWTLY